VEERVLLNREKYSFLKALDVFVFEQMKNKLEKRGVFVPLFKCGNSSSISDELSESKLGRMYRENDEIIRETEFQIEFELSDYESINKGLIHGIDVRE